MQSYFPKHFPKVQNFSYFTAQYKRLQLMLEHVQEENFDYDNEYKQAEIEVLKYNKPQSWNVHDTGNMEKVLEVDFAVYGVMVAKATKQDLKELTAFMFYASVEALEKQDENAKKTKK